MSWLTGSCAARDIPASPRSRPQAQPRYWTTNGRSRCNCWRSASRLAGVALRPRIARAASPGIACVAAKTTTETRTRTMTPYTTRRMTNAQKGLSSRAGRAGRARPALIKLGLASLAVEPDGAVAMPIPVELQRSLAGAEARHLGAVRVDEVTEEGDYVSAGVVLLQLHGVDDLTPLRLVDLGNRLLVEVRKVGSLGWPVRGIERRCREAADRDLR